MAQVFDGGKGQLVTSNCHEDTAKLMAKGRWAHFFRSSTSTLTKYLRSSGSGGQVVAMMQTAHPWHRYYSATCIGVAHCRATGRRSFPQREMRPVVVMVADILAHQPFQMPSIENDHMVEEIPAAVADPTLGDTVLPRASEAGLAGGPGPISNK